MKHILLLLLIPSLLLSQPKFEFRGLWVAASRLDFPLSTLASDQKAELDRIVDFARFGKFNAIIFQVLARGQAYYESSIVPWASYLTSPLTVDQDGTLYPNIGTPPGTKENPPQFYDPLKYLIQKAKQYGIEVHAWINVFNLITLPDTVYRLAISQPRHIAIDESNRWNTKIFAKNSAGEWLIPADGSKLIWLDPANPFVRNYLVSVVVELVKNYDIDAIHFDYIRFPGAYTYGDSFNYYFNNRTDFVNGNPYGLSRDDFARLSIERFVRAAYDTVRKIKPKVKVGSTTPGIYQGWRLPIKQVYFDLYRDGRSDPRKWAQLGIIDYHAPQVYWDIGSDYDFRVIAQDWNANMYDKHVYIGIYGDNPYSEVSAQVNFTRSIVAKGNVIFRYANAKTYIDSLVANQYTTFAIPPAMPWKDNVPPNPPVGLSIRKISSNVWQLIWSNPATASDGERPAYYVIYRAEGIGTVDINDPKNIISIVPSAVSINTYNDRIPDTSKIYTYVVTSLDRLKNESQPSNSVITHVLADQEFVDKYDLSPGYPNPFNSVVNFKYSVPEVSFVDIRIFDLLGREVKKIFSGVQSSGDYQIYWDGRDNSGNEVTSGIYLCKMNALKNGKLVFSKAQKVSLLK
ncbi:MAG: family 10 glycosylhydrolase [Candidatus Kryptonium sp.]|nr:family 10 glycosylhydrolase [Candidatus Kryptonium sp.]MDW8109832.1 family 10 glycosylhydrolase [Candidatus Kryptonium sp.]